MRKRVALRVGSAVAGGILALLSFGAEARAATADLIEIQTTIESLDISGGPFPIPLASDPSNVLGDSIDGYGFVDSQVLLTLSSQRVVNPGPASTGQAVAFLGGLPANGNPLEPIDPALLDGELFFVDSFFDVFFDITLTDVDGRPGRDYAGQPNGASILLTDNGPSQWFSGYEAVFDKDAPLFGLFPPAEADPYIGDFQVEIPLGGDINGNGVNDKIKFTLGTLSVGDENRSFITLPDGTVIVQFDGARFLQGAVVDETTDPPFTIGAQLPNGLPDPGSFFGPGSFTGQIQNPTVPEPAAAGLLALALLGLAWRARR